MAAHWGHSIVLSVSCDNWMIHQSGDLVCCCLFFSLFLFVAPGYKEWTVITLSCRSPDYYDIMFISSIILARRPVFDSDIPSFPQITTNCCPFCCCSLVASSLSVATHRGFHEPVQVCLLTLPPSPLIIPSLPTSTCLLNVPSHFCSRRMPVPPMLWSRWNR